MFHRRTNIAHRFRAASTTPASENAAIGYNASSFCFFYQQTSSHSAINGVKNVTATILKSDGPAPYREVDWSMIAMKSRVQGIMIPSRRRPNWRFHAVLCLAGAEVVKRLRPANSCSVPGTHLILLMHFGVDAVHAKIRNDDFRLLFRYQMAARKGLPLEGRLRLRPPAGQHVPEFRASIGSRPTGRRISRPHFRRKA
jgi:hypothetical protein